MVAAADGAQATPDPQSVPMTETTLVNHLAAIDNRLGVKMSRTEEKVDHNTVKLKSLRERVEKNEDELDDRLLYIFLLLRNISPVLHFTYSCLLLTYYTLVHGASGLSSRRV